MQPTLSGARAGAPNQTPTVSDTHPANPVDNGDDPVTDWLLQLDDLGATEFSVLFAIHKLRARRRQAGWIRRRELCRSASLDPAALARVLTTLRTRGLLWMANHPVKTGYARYFLIVQ